MSSELPETVDGVPNLSGSEEKIRKVLQRPRVAQHLEGAIDFPRIRAGFACALHMHQPLVLAEGSELGNAAIVSNLKRMMDNPHEGDNHNAGVFHWCYKRMGEFIPALVREGKQPRIMLEYSGTLLYGLRAMGLHDVFDALVPLAQNPKYARCVEWLGAPWGHAVAPSTPVQDFRLHVQAFQHHFAAIFGLSALTRLRGFSPSEMALPNQPDVAYAFVKTLRDCGYRWVLVQEHTVERVEDGAALREKHVPHRLVAKNTEGETASIVAIVKTQGSDTKLVGQMQPYYEAKSAGATELAGKRIPRLVTQIADGENGGVMMNEFSPKFMEVMREASGSEVPPLNVSEYLDYLESAGIHEKDFPSIQPIFHHRIWQRYQAGSGPERLAAVITELAAEDSRFHVEGGSWTNNVSWVRGYDDVLRPMERASALFAQRILQALSPRDARYRNALFHLLAAETSCYRYWGKGTWTDYGRELAERTIRIAHAVGPAA
jgi:Glycosyl hydrolase family 57